MPYNKFLRHLQYEKRYSVFTITAYETDLRQFFEFLTDTYQVSEPKDVTHFYVRSWVVSMMEKKINPRSVNRKITALKSFFKFLLRDKTITKGPMLRIISPKISKRLPTFVDKAKMNQLLDEIDYGEGFSGIRNKLIIDFFYQTGMRLSELINLNETDVDLHKLSIKVLGKRNKERIIPISHNLKDAINEYKSHRQVMLVEKNKENIFFFFTNDANKLYPKFVYRLVKEKLSLITTGGKKSPHVLRHTFATQMLNEGAEINAVKELLGHSSLAATQVYTHNTIEKLKNIYKQAHPKA